MSDFNLARAEALRVLEIIEKQQLHLFRQRELMSADVLSTRLDALKFRPFEEGMTGIRELLHDVLAVYNDPFAGYINPKQHKSYTERRKGGYVGIGIKFRARNEAYPVAIGTIIGGPLSKKDIEPGDEIVSVNGMDLKALKSSKVSAALSGPTGTIANLTLRRGKESIDVSSIRQAVKLYYARAEVIEKDVGYIKLSRFGAASHKRVESLVQALLEKGVKGFVLDLRDNPGGSTRAARNIMSLFDPSDWVYCERYQSGKVRKMPREGTLLTNLPLAVLINEETISSSEILAGAFQEYGRAKLVGTPTFGKGLIQRVFPLKEPVSGAVRVTVASYATPSEQLLHGRGLKPDVYVPSPPEPLFKEVGSVNITQAARDYRQGLLFDGLSSRYSASEITALEALPDTQLSTAVEALDLA